MSRLFRDFSVGTTGPEKNSRGNTEIVFYYFWFMVYRIPTFFGIRVVNTQSQPCTVKLLTFMFEFCTNNHWEVQKLNEYYPRSLYSIQIKFMRRKLYSVVSIFTTSSRIKMHYAVTPSPCCSWSLWEHRFTQPTSSATSRLPTQKNVKATI